MKYLNNKYSTDQIEDVPMGWVINVKGYCLTHKKMRYSSEIFESYQSSYNSIDVLLVIPNDSFSIIK